MTRTRITACAVFTAACFLAPPAHAAIELEPGEWQDTETGTENGQPAKPEVTTNCVTPEDAKDPVKALSQLKDSAARQCKTLQVKDSGNTLSLDIECGDPKQVSLAITLNITFLTSRHYTGTAKSSMTLGDHKLTADKQFDSKWIGATCTKK